MDFDLTILPKAEEDIRRAWKWYAEKEINLESQFETYLEDSIQYVCSNPYKLQIRYQEIRVQYLKKFPFGIHFTVIDKEVLILAVLHTSQSPDSWPDYI